MRELISKIILLIDEEDRRRVALILLLMLLTAVLQSTGIVSIMPFLAVLSNPGLIESNPALQAVYAGLGFTDKQSFLYFLGVAAFIIFCTGTACQALNTWVVTRFSTRQQFRLSSRLMADYLRRPYAFFLTRNSSDMAKTVLQETGMAVGGVLMPSMQLVGHVLIATALTSLLLLADPVLAIGIAITIGGGYALLFYVSRLWLTRTGKMIVEINKKRFRSTADCFAGAKEIRLLGREQDYLRQYSAPSEQLAGIAAKRSLFSNLPLYVIEALAFGGIMLVILYMMKDLEDLSGALPILALYALAGRQLIPGFNKIFAALAEIRSSIPFMDKVLEDLGGDEHSRRSLPPAESMERLPLEHSIVLDDLCFTYETADHRALDALNLTVKARTTIGFVGASGSGKSTLVDLLLGLLKPESGKICVDGVQLTAETIPRWQANIGYVPQHIFLTDRTVSENIALGVPREQIDQAAVERAAKLSNLHDFVCNELPDGYETLIGDRGVRLSGGQRQRIGIARALYRDPEVLVFDEATSALDNATERAVMSAINNLSGSKTIFLVAHRLTTVRGCDEIFVMSKGKFSESGNWDYLIKYGEHFSALAAGHMDSAA